jgi:hypothetical protein
MRDRAAASMQKQDQNPQIAALQKQLAEMTGSLPPPPKPPTLLKPGRTYYYIPGMAFGTKTSDRFPVGISVDEMEQQCDSGNCAGFDSDGWKYTGIDYKGGTPTSSGGMYIPVHKQQKTYKPGTNIVGGLQSVPVVTPSVVSTDMNYMKYVCDNMPQCKAFDSTGKFYHSYGDGSSVPGITIYTAQ